VIPATEGSEAIDLYQQHKKNGNPIDIIIMDLTVPGGMGGVKTAEKMLAIDPQAKLIVSTAFQTFFISSGDNTFACCHLLIIYNSIIGSLMW